MGQAPLCEAPCGPISLGARDLTAGNHRLSVEIVGANEKAKKGYMFGLDQIMVSPVA